MGDDAFIQSTNVIMYLLCAHHWGNGAEDVVPALQELLFHSRGEATGVRANIRKSGNKLSDGWWVEGRLSIQES